MHDAHRPKGSVVVQLTRYRDSRIEKRVVLSISPACTHLCFTQLAFTAQTLGTSEVGSLIIWVDIKGCSKFLYTCVEVTLYWRFAGQNFQINLASLMMGAHQKVALTCASRQSPRPQQAPANLGSSCKAWLYSAIASSSLPWWR